MLLLYLPLAHIESMITVTLMTECRRMCEATHRSRRLLLSETIAEKRLLLTKEKCPAISEFSEQLIQNGAGVDAVALKTETGTPCVPAPSLRCHTGHPLWWK